MKLCRRTAYSGLLWMIVLVFGCGSAEAQIPDICEGTVPDGWHAQSRKLSISSERYKTGRESVKWEWSRRKRTLTIRDTAFSSAADDPRSTFIIWIYNEIPIADTLHFEFQDQGEAVSHFGIGLKFSGWRTAWIMYHRDMEGGPVKGMNTLVIKAPPSVKKGSLYFDQVISNISINPRSPMRDEQVPFVNIHSDKAANAHWTALYQFSRNPHYLPLQGEVSSAETQAFGAILERYRKIILPSKKSGLTAIEQEFGRWNIQKDGNNITGRPVYSVNDVELVPDDARKSLKEEFKEFSIKPYTQLMLKAAAAYQDAKPAEKERLAQIYLNLIDHLEDQGWAAGSGMGALHHLGYNFRDYYSANLLMKSVLKQHDRLERTWKSMYWFSGLGRTQVPPADVDDSNIDVFNTLLGSMLSTVLIMDDTPEKARQLCEFSNWFSQALMPTYSIDGTFKPDGSVVHHGNLYPAYGVGGFQGIAPILYALSRTPFKVSTDAHQNFKKVMLAMHYYTNPVRWPVSVSGRHPTGSWKIADEAYAYMAVSGTPDGKASIDREMAAVYLKIDPDAGGKWAEQFKGLGIRPAPYPQGHWNLNYGLFDIHRRQDWLLTVRGHNRYFTTHESYPGANMYGRYFSYGHLEVLFPQTETNSGSNFKDEGWDWNNIPGTTTLHLPLDKLRAAILNVDDFSGVEEMLLSDEIFAGGTNFNQWQGMFAMRLHGHDKYDMGSFRAIKSWFMFDSLVICLGSDISNTIEENPTQTTLFQNILDSAQAVFYLNDEKNTVFPYEQEWGNTQRLTVVDNRGIGYYLPWQQGAVFTKLEQSSRDQKDSKDTHGSAAKLIFDHGTAPKDQGYEYAMLIKTDPAEMHQFKTRMNSSNPVYKVLQKDSAAHAVWYAPKQITAIALFEGGKGYKDSLLISNSIPCLLMYRRGADTLQLSVTDPDLAFYTGPDDSPLTSDGKRQEVSIYSRSWYRAPSQPSVVELVIRGSWKAVPSENGVESHILPNGDTQLLVPCKYGLASEVKLEEIKK